MLLPPTPLAGSAEKPPSPSPTAGSPCAAAAGASNNKLAGIEITALPSGGLTPAASFLPRLVGRERHLFAGEMDSRAGQASGEAGRREAAAGTSGSVSRFGAETHRGLRKRRSAAPGCPRR